MPPEKSFVNLKYWKTIGRPEQAGSGFRGPISMARDSGDLMFVVCRSSEYRPEGTRVTVCTLDEDFVTDFARGVPREGPHTWNTDDGSLVWPTCITLDSQETLYISDEWLNRISMFSKDGEYLGKWEERSGTGDGEMDRPSGMVFDADDNVLIVDSGNNRVQKFTKDGQFISKWGTGGAGQGELNMPWGIALDSQGDVYVADWRNDRIQKFSPDGEFIQQFGVSGSGDGQLNRPTDVAVDKEGVVYVADWQNDRLQAFDSAGNVAAIKTGDATVSKWGRDKLNANPEMWNERDRAPDLERERYFWCPIAVTVDDDNNVFVVEAPRSRIQIYQKQPLTFLAPGL